ncbi:unnamed protein product [Brachionus calyciflorus]|uniref:EF-hand domain-containing protein n=1 Tax=Brachionus calyciflorus TaxID=104777 RepID=A0A813UDK2_9BILA|nr:unnamed protein product [Brachionus calyciflorus]
MQESVAAPIEGARPHNFGHIYAGKFKDLKPDARAAGILTYAPGENVDMVLRQNLNSAPTHNISPNINRFRAYNYPDVGEIRFHYGHANDSKFFEKMTHGVKTEKNFSSKDCVNPPIPIRINHLKNEMKESLYKSHKSAPLGRVPKGNLPSSIDPLSTTFGVNTNKSESAKECVNPDKPRFLVELETSDKHEMYVFSHKDYEPGEQKDRLFSDSFDRYKRFGLTHPVHHDGRLTKESMNWLPTKLMAKRTQSESLLLDDFREKNTSQVGKKLDPNKETRFVGDDHVFGLTNTADHFSAGDIIHSRSEQKIMKGKDRERAYTAVLRSDLARYNLVKFKTLVDAFKFYDKDKDGFVTGDDLKFVSSHSGFPASDELLRMLLRDCDYDQDGKLNFLEFTNFLCFKESMKTGIDVKPTAETAENDIRDDEGRILLKEKDLVPKNNVAVNELVPRTLSKQIDGKAASWETTYDVINKAPFRHEPLKKRVYGVPTIRNDIPAPEFKKIQDRTNYGTDGNAWSLLAPSVFSHHGVYERDVLQPRSKEMIKQLMRKIGYNLSDEQFDATWEAAKTLNPYGEVSIEEFRWALNDNRTNLLQKNESTFYNHEENIREWVNTFELKSSASGWNESALAIKLPTFLPIWSKYG